MGACVSVRVKEGSGEMGGLFHERSMRTPTLATRGKLATLETTNNATTDSSGVGPSLRPARSIVSLFVPQTENVLDVAIKKLSAHPGFIQNPMLNISRNELTMMPTSFHSLAPYLTDLDVSSNSLQILPIQIGDLLLLKNLDLSGNKLESIPVEIGNLVNLEVLLLYTNKLALVPDEVGLLTKCRTLNVFNNFLIKLPKQLSNLKELVEFNAGDNKIKTTPKFENMSSLIRLALFHNTIVSMQPLENLDTLQKLDFSKNQIDNFPNMGAFPKMVELLASNNRFTVLPEDIGKHSNLQMFEAAHNKLTTIPASISQLSKLWKLMLSENKLAALPPELFSLPLRTLDLTRNQFAMFPDELPKLSQTLVCFQIDFNNIEHIPEYFTDTAFAKLTRLTFFGNPIIWEGDDGARNFLFQEELRAKFEEKSVYTYSPAAWPGYRAA
jgi:Leucine-rich repeat (LRR) protein